MGDLEILPGQVDGPPRGDRLVGHHRADARHVLADLLRDASAERIHVYCPDPWPKKRHHKRRLFDADTTRHLERILAPGGYLHVSTDFDEYFEWIVASVAANTRLVPAQDPEFPDAPAGGNTNIHTNIHSVVRTRLVNYTIRRKVW